MDDKIFTRKEKFLNAILTGSTRNLDEPLTREEQLLLEIAENGVGGTKGEDGKSAYQHAVEGGYEGTEEEFDEGLANVTALSNETPSNINFGSEVVVDVN